MKSLRRQLTRWLLATLAVLVGATLVVIYLVVWNEIRGAFDNALRARAAAVSALIEQVDGRIQNDFNEEFLRDYGAKKPRHYFEIWDANGVVALRSPSLQSADLQPGAKAPVGDARVWNVTLPNGRPGRATGFTFVPVAGDEAKPGMKLLSAHVVVVSDREDLDETLGGLLAAIAGAGLAFFAAVWLVVPWVLRRGLQPLDQLGEQVSRIDAGSLTAPLPVTELPSELRPIGDRLNALLARLATSFERERRFSADLAHELRTPLAELRSLAECALKWPEARDQATDREVLAIATQMEALVTRMLMLARGERGSIAAALVPVEVAPLVADITAAAAKSAATRGLRFSVEVASGAASADPTLLRSVIANLVDNATAHAPVGSEVRIRGEAIPGGYRLRCANPAEDLTADDVTKLFERFWRKEAARSGGGEHVGLGLSLAQTLATAMGWRLNARLAEGWLTFTLESGAR